MRTLRWVPLALSAALPLVVAAACGSDFGDCSSTNSCNLGTGGGTSGGASGESGGSSSTTGGTESGEGASGMGASAATGPDLGGSGGSGGSGPAVCEDDGTSPSEKPCLVDEEFAVFVAPSGDDNDGDGSRENPFATVGRGLEAAIDASLLHVIACNGDYAEAVSVDEDTDGLSLHGGFACPGEDNAWTYEEGTQSSVKPDDPGYALEVSGLTQGLTIEDFEFTARDAEEHGESSVAAFVADSGNVLLRRVKLAAGKGVEGTEGNPQTIVFPSADRNGKDATGNAGGEGNVCECPNTVATTTGASGGNGGASPTGGGLGQPNQGGGAAGVVGQACAGTGTGGNGEQGETGVHGDGAGFLGQLTSNGWVPEDGKSGTVGGPGQGGGGGAGFGPANPGGGGGGGCGACGGGEGSGGGGGGASIALLVFESAITLEACDLSSDDAGAGGAGGFGQEGDPIGGAKGNGAGNACDGGSGGPGGDGGPGGGGAGGLSAGIVFSGDEPDVSDDTVIEPGTKGDAGTSPGNDGIDGDSQEVVDADNL